MRVNDVVQCVKLSKNNIEKLVDGDFYIIKSLDKHENSIILTLENKDGELRYAMPHHFVYKCTVIDSTNIPPIKEKDLVFTIKPVVGLQLHWWYEVVQTHKDAITLTHFDGEVHRLTIASINSFAVDNRLYEKRLKEEIHSLKPTTPKVEPVQKFDVVEKPKHYNSYNGFEVIDIVTEATKNLKGIEAVCIGNLLKYVLRYQFKNGVQDLKKAKWYLERVIKELEKEGI